MNKKELVRSVLSGQAVPRPPASFWYHFPRHQHSGAAAIAAHLDFYRETNVDFLKVMNEHLYRDESPPATASDWRHVRPAPLSAPFYQALLNELKHISDAVGDETMILVTIHGVFASAFHATQSPEETFSHANPVTAHLRENPQAVMSGLDAISDSLAELSLACLAAGADGIYYAALGGEDYRFTEEEFLQYIKPFDLKILNAIQPHGEFNILHVCKDRVRMPLYADYPSHVVNWSVHEQNPDLLTGRTLFKRPILGGMDYRGVIVDGPVEAIQTQVHEIMDKWDGNDLMLGADCTLPGATPTAHIRAAVEATYPA